jgi:hypothetical protein
MRAMSTSQFASNPPTTLSHSRPGLRPGYDNGRMTDIN